MTSDNHHIGSDYSTKSILSLNQNHSINVLKELIFDLRGVCKDLCNLVHHIDKIANRAEEKLSQLIIDQTESPINSKSQEEILINISKNKKLSFQESKYSRSKSQPILKPNLATMIKLPIEPIYESLNSSDLPFTKKPLSKSLKRNSMIESSFYEDKLEDELEKELLKNRFIQTTTSSPSTSSEKSSESKQRTNHVCFNLNNTIYTPKNDIPIPITALKGTKPYESQLKQKNSDKLKDVLVDSNKKSFGLTKIIRKNSCTKNDF